MMPSFLICGIEHSGTTLLSDIFRQTPDYDSGFEGGVLLSKSPHDFRSAEPFISNLKSGWGVDDLDLDYICTCDSYAECYARLYERSSVLNRSKKKIFDKTPRYLNDLEAVVSRADIPIFICYKDPRSIVLSDFKRAISQAEKKEEALGFENWYDQYLPAKKRYMRTLYRNSELARTGELKNCLPVPLEQICLDTRRTLNNVFSFAEEKFDLRYLNIDDLRFEHTRAPFIASNIPFEYFKVLTGEQILQVERDFSEFKNWFYG